MRSTSTAVRARGSGGFAAASMLGVVLGAVLGVVGCGPYAQWQAELASQGREGLRRVDAAREASSKAVRQYLLERRQRLDEAFDADVRAQGTLDAEFVIAARRLYAAGLDGLAEAAARQAEADRVAADNAAAADAALAALQRLLEAQGRVRLPGRER
ncbi:MAG: hypothetical protein ACK4PI_01080 [Tepidisphaerales bacterium]